MMTCDDVLRAPSESARHVRLVGCHSTQRTNVQNTSGDVVGNFCQALANGVTVSNVGGYQSSHDMLEPDTWWDSDEEEEEEEEEEDEKDEQEEEGGDADGDEQTVGGGGRGEAENTAGKAARPANTLKGWGLLSRVACAAHERVRDSAQRCIAPTDLYGWLNSNNAVGTTHTILRPFIHYLAP